MQVLIEQRKAKDQVEDKVVFSSLIKGNPIQIHFETMEMFDKYVFIGQMVTTSSDLELKISTTKRKKKKDLNGVHPASAVLF